MMIRKRTLVLALLATVAAAPAMAGTTIVSTGVNYSSGKYGTDTTTDIWYVPLSFGYNTGKWRFKVTVPYIRISGNGNVVPGVGRVDNRNPLGLGHGRGLLAPGNGGSGTGTTQTGSSSASGLGDVVAQASYNLFYDKSSRFGMDLGAKVKFGTADENKGLGTGQNDYGLNLDAYKGIGNWTLFGGVGYMTYGSSQYIQLDNGANANIGVSYRFSDHNTLGAYYYYRERISDSGYAQKELTAYWNHDINKRVRLQMYALTGFSDGSPDVGGGASLRWSF
ncbi:MAG TPA: transporter [Rhodanobacteraceae bacterium]|nr:transporter [Rhodanobacteraceae bacterium]